MIDMGGGALNITGGNIKTTKNNAENMRVINAHGENSIVTITGGAVSSSGDSRTGCLYISDGAYLSMSGGTAEANGLSNDNVTIDLRSGGTADLSGTAQVKNNSRSSVALCVWEGSSATISGDAEIENTANSGIAAQAYSAGSLNNNGGQININGGSIINSGKNGIAVDIDRTDDQVNGGTVVMTDGVIENANTESGEALSIDNSFEMSGGSVIQRNPNSAAIVNDVTESSDLKGQMNINIFGGNITATGNIFNESITAEDAKHPVISGGIFSEPVTGYVTDDKAQATYTEGATTLYVVGDSISEVIEEAGDGAALDITEGNADIKNAPAGLKVSNSGDGEVKVNGVNVGENPVTACEHDYAEGWTSDENNHWKKCQYCESITDQGAHTFTWITDKEATATEAGSKHEECTVCGYAKAAVVIPATGVVDDTQDPTQPTEPQDPGTPGSGTDQPTEPQEPANDKTSATGDGSNIALWAALMAVAAIGAAGTVVYSRKRRIQ